MVVLRHCSFAKIHEFILMISYRGLTQTVKQEKIIVSVLLLHSCIFLCHNKHDVCVFSLMWNTLISVSLPLLLHQYDLLLFTRTLSLNYHP